MNKYSKTKYFSGELRIISGKWKNKKIKIPNKYCIRPTLSRVRKILFDWLSPFIEFSYCLDCYSGSGILGLEALSRNASYVLFLDKSINICNYIAMNVNLLKTNKARIICTNVFNLSIVCKRAFDIIFIDPPFFRNMINPTIFFLYKNDFLSKNSILYIETEITAPNIIVPMCFELYKKKQTKKNIYYLYIRIK